mmetsp:Transcript_9938/g.13622  ORF Transcript_9938/g.13622 Transcript_9938/m.13622 type:complete len:109 (-) Transcript_9938:428-754(-)
MGRLEANKTRLLNSLNHTLILPITPSINSIHELTFLNTRTFSTTQSSSHRFLSHTQHPLTNSHHSLTRLLTRSINSFTHSITHFLQLIAHRTYTHSSIIHYTHPLTPH